MLTAIETGYKLLRAEIMKMNIETNIVKKNVYDEKRLHETKENI